MVCMQMLETKWFDGKFYERYYEWKLRQDDIVNINQDLEKVVKLQPGT